MGAVFVVLLIVSFAATDAWASIIEVISLNFTGAKGLIIDNFYVNANIPSTYSGTVNTGKTLTATSYSSNTFSAGTSGYILSPQFPTETHLPSGTMALVMYTAATPSLDGNASNSVDNLRNTKTLTASFATSNSNDIIYVIVAVRSTSRIPSISSSPSLSWLSRGPTTGVSDGGPTGVIYAFYAKSTNALSTITITATLSGNGKTAFTLIAFGVSGANYANPFDSNSPWNAKSTTTGKTATVTLNPSPSTANDLIIGGVYLSNAETTITPTTGYTQISKVGTNMTSSSEVKNWASTDSGQTLTYSWSNNLGWAIIADAIVPSTSLTATVSASSVNSGGTQLVSFFSNQQSAALSVDGSPVLSFFNLTPGTLPAGSYLQIKIVAPASTSIKIYWGDATKPTNFQVCYMNSSPT